MRWGSTASRGWPSRRTGDRLAVVGQRPPADLTAAYREPAGRILGAALTDVEGWEKLDHLATVIGHRLSGSEGLERAIDWAAERMEAEGLAVRKQPVMVPHWVRGRESAAVVGADGAIAAHPRARQQRRHAARGHHGAGRRRRQLRGARGAGARSGSRARSWSTPSSGMATGEPCSTAVAGASRAAALGAVAALIRSATGHSLSTPHTGGIALRRGAAEDPGGGDHRRGRGLDAPA